MQGIQRAIDIPQMLPDYDARVQILPPHPEAGKTGRVSNRFYYRAKRPGEYTICDLTVTTRGNHLIHVTPSEVMVIGKPRRWW
jgi:hypothetical protein